METPITATTWSWRILTTGGLLALAFWTGASWNRINTLAERQEQITVEAAAREGRVRALEIAGSGTAVQLASIARSLARIEAQLDEGRP